MPHIAVIPERNKGHTHVIADLHGNRACLEAVLEETIKKNENDALVVLGDLVDRGKDSPGVVRLLKEAQHANPNRIFVIRGNHEESCLDTISCLINALVNDPLIFNYKGMVLLKQFAKYANEKAMAHIQWNGGMWLMQLFSKEVSKGKIALGSNENGKYIRFAQDSQIHEVAEYMSSLPYIVISKENEFRPALVGAHASVMLTDKQLEERLQTGRGLSKEEIEYTVWARAKDLWKTERAAHSTVAYVGHNVVIGGAPAVRPNENTINLDFGAFRTNVMPVVDHESGTCRLIGASPEAVLGAMRNPLIRKGLEDVRQHLSIQSKIELDKVHESTMPKELKPKVINSTKEMLSKLASNMEVQEDRLVQQGASRKENAARVENIKSAVSGISAASSNVIDKSEVSAKPEVPAKPDVLEDSLQNLKRSKIR